MGELRDKRVLDLGCGEGKNAAFLAKAGAVVTAVDVSAQALRNGKAIWGDVAGLTWVQGDATSQSWPPSSFDIVILYGFLHCLPNEAIASRVVAALKKATSPAGFHVVCSFNSRHHELRDAHPGFSPLLLPHSYYLALYRNWSIVESSDNDLVETHPHNLIEHRHTMTRIIAVNNRDNS
jgi:2-polyprenyl-3-methyl-5-hydroxy-6-metoxy-1,4-benzoquinol methylase